jgi:hypothetical protein
VEQTAGERPHAGGVSDEVARINALAQGLPPRVGARDEVTSFSVPAWTTTFRLQNGGALTDLQQQLRHAEFATTQICAAAVNERRRAMVIALDCSAASAAKAPTKPHVARRRARQSS